MGSEKHRYDASQITVLTGLEVIRKRPGMYVGSTGRRGLHHLVYEVAERAVNEVLAGRASTVEVTLLPDGGVRVADDGPGVPLEDGDEPGLHWRLTQLGAGWRGASSRTMLTSWTMGLCVVNALSSRLTAETRHEGVRRVREYARGVERGPVTDQGPTDRTGTSFTFWPDAEIFETTAVSYEVLAERFRELAFLNRGLDITLTDGKRSDHFRSPHGAQDFVDFLDAGARDRLPEEAIAFEVVDETMGGSVEVALRWSEDVKEQVKGYANSLSTLEGGAHLHGFREGMSVVLDADFARIARGLTAVVSVKLDEPEMQGATRTWLANEPVREAVRRAVEDQLGRWLREHPREAAAVRAHVGRE